MRDQAFRLRMLRCAILGGVLAALCLGEAQSLTSDLGVTDRVMAASTIYSLIQQYFAHWEGAPRPEIEAAYREYIDHAVRDKSRKEFDLATLRFIARLRNGHTQFFDDQLDGRPLKFRLLEVENEWVVVNSQDSHLQRGAVVRTLDGKAVDDFVREQAQYVAASNERLARTHVFTYAGLFPDRISIGLQNGNVVVVDRSVRADAPGAAAPRASEGRWLREGQVAYIRIPGFGDPAFERTAIELVRQFASSPNLVIDVRGNGGGATPFQLIAALMNQPRRPWQEATPQHIALFEAQGMPPLRLSREFPPQSPSAGAYAGRLFLLVDRFCGSACEDFVMPFKDTRRAVVIGETTQGSSGNPYRADLGKGMWVAIGAVRYRFPDGTPFEGIGIAPDVTIERRLSDIAAARDAVLEREQELADAPR
jgi:carboxyl-terminal processing protease